MAFATSRSAGWSVDARGPDGGGTGGFDAAAEGDGGVGRAALPLGAVSGVETVWMAAATEGSPPGSAGVLVQETAANIANASESEPFMARLNTTAPRRRAIVSAGCALAPCARDRHPPRASTSAATPASTAYAAAIAPTLQATPRTTPSAERRVRPK